MGKQNMILKIEYKKINVPTLKVTTRQVLINYHKNANKIKAICPFKSGKKVTRNYFRHLSLFKVVNQVTFLGCNRGC